MTTEILMTIVIVALIVLNYLYVREYGKREQRYMNAIFAKSLPELVEADIKTEEPPQPKAKPDELVPMDQLSDEDFFSTVTPTKEKSWLAGHLPKMFQPKE